MSRMTEYTPCPCCPSGEGHEDQEEVPLKENPWVLSGEAGKKDGESRVMAHIWEVHMAEGGGISSSITWYCAWGQLSQKRQVRNSVIRGIEAAIRSVSCPTHQAQKMCYFPSLMDFVHLCYLLEESSFPK